MREAAGSGDRRKQKSKGKGVRSNSMGREGGDERREPKGVRTSLSQKDTRRRMGGRVGKSAAKHRRGVANGEPKGTLGEDHNGAKRPHLRKTGLDVKAVPGPGGPDRAKYWGAKGGARGGAA